MRKSFPILKIIISLLLLATTRCETEKIIFRGPYHVRFSKSASFEKESFSQPIEIEVHLVGPALDQDVTMTYGIGGDAREGVDYTILDDRTKVTIPAGEYFGSIRIQLINNANNILRSQAIVFTLLTTDVNDLAVGQGESAIGKIFTFTIFDDCILGGTYAGMRTSGSSTYDDLSITSQDCENYVLSNWNLGVFTSDTEMDLKFVDNGDNTLTIPEQEEENLDPDLATIMGTGVVDPETREIIMSITLVDFDNQPVVSIVLQPR